MSGIPSDKPDDLKEIAKTAGENIISTFNFYVTCFRQNRTEL